MGYLFKSQFTPAKEPGLVAKLTIKRLSSIWASFARTGDPNTAPKDVLPVQWKSVEPDRVHFVDIGENITVGCGPEETRMKFWDGIYAMQPITSKL